jgi:hypothetical protein
VLFGERQKLLAVGQNGMESRFHSLSVTVGTVWPQL